MNNEMQIFNSPEFGQLRTVVINGVIWAAGKDVAAALGYSNTRDALSRHVDDDDKGVSQITTPSGKQNMTVINESGLYSLILSSQLPSAKRFKHWVTSEVLPAIRKSGSYTAAAERKAIPSRTLTSDDYIRAADIIARCTCSRLPIVIGLLEQSGLDMPLTAHRNVNVEVDRQHLMDVLDRYSVRGAAKLTDLAPAVISRYRRGTSTPRPARYARLIEILE